MPESGTISLFCLSYLLFSSLVPNDFLKKFHWYNFLVCPSGTKYFFLFCCAWFRHNFLLFKNHNATIPFLILSIPYISSWYLNIRYSLPDFKAVGNLLSPFMPFMSRRTVSNTQNDFYQTAVNAYSCKNCILCLRFYKKVVLVQLFCGFWVAYNSKVRSGHMLISMKYHLKISISEKNTAFFSVLTYSHDWSSWDSGVRQRFPASL